MSDDEYEYLDEDDDISEDLDESEDENEGDDNDDKEFDIEDVVVSNLKDNDIIDINQMETLLNSTDKKTSDKITKYEYTKVIGLRATQLSHGMPALIDTRDLTEPYAIAIEEYKENKIPFIIKRPLADGESYEYWRLGDLKKNNNILI
jgi:DNA-directed RNA polymerase subunit K/omega